MHDEAMRQGRATAFTQADQLRQWVILYSGPLLRLAFTLLGDEFAAQDCVQEAFIKAGLKSHQLRNVDRPLTWLAKIVVNECRVWHKRRRRLAIQSRHELPEPSTEDTYPSMSGLGLRELVGTLPYKQRIALQLYYWADYSTAEVAEIMGVSESTSRVLLHRGRQSLKEMLGGNGDGNKQ